jgi:hypothetical protein
MGIPENTDMKPPWESPYPFGGIFLGLIVHKSRIKGYFEVNHEVLSKKL